MTKQKIKHREVNLIDSKYQPSTAELKEDRRIDVTFEDLARLVATPVKVRYVKPERKTRG